MPVPKLADVLRQSGLTQEQIDALDAKAMSSFTSVLSAAEQAEQDALKKHQEATTALAKAEADRKAAEQAAEVAKAAQDKAELDNRSVKEFWDNTYNPGMAAAETEKKRLAKLAADAVAERDYYKAQRASYLDTLGIKPEDAPEFKPKPVDPANPVTPGTPTFTDPSALVAKVGDGFNVITDIQWKYGQLYPGQSLPIPPSKLIEQADALKLSPMEYAARTFKFAEKEDERRQAAAKAHDDEIRKAESDRLGAEHKVEMDRIQNETNAKIKTLTEQSAAGGNPDLKLPPGSAKFAELQRATKAGERPDPTKMSAEQRRAMTLNNIHKAIEERQTVSQ